jgi:molecular chaperone Hsp33
MDRLVRGIDRAGTVRVVTAVTTDVVREGCRRHGLRGVEAVILGRALTAGCVLVTLTKNDDERLRISLQADGPVGRMLVDARGNGDVRGCLERRLETPADPPTGLRPSIADWVGRSGRLVLTRDVGLEHQYQGVVAVESGEIDLDLERYLGESEQLPSALACEVVLDAQGDVVRAAGILCQTFPGGESTPIEAIRANVHGDAFPALLRHDRSADELMGFALLGGDFEVMGQSALRFRCTCGVDRALAVVSTLGADDIEALANEPGDTEVRCSYCGESYTIDPADLLALAARLRTQRS